MNLLTADRLRELLAYDPQTGAFTWRLARVAWNGRRVIARPGDVAGTVCKNGYRAINIDGTPRLEHRLAFLWMTGEWPEADVDHINGDRADNRWANLRPASRRMNLQNRRGPSSNRKHGHLLGTAWHAKTQKWRALIKHDGRQKSLGYYETEQAAHYAYVEAKRRLHEGCTI